MNLVIDDAVEVKLAKKDAPEERRKLGEHWSFLLVSLHTNAHTGQVLLKGDNISLIQSI
jgi:small nuclear ribonucleoprotein E